MNNHAAGLSSGRSRDGARSGGTPGSPSILSLHSRSSSLQTNSYSKMVFVLVGTIFVPIGVASLLASRKVVEIVDRYDDACVPANMSDKLAYIQNSTISKTCTRTLKVPENMMPSVFVYYQLDNFSRTIGGEGQNSMA